jgi:hypothetical protein
MLWSGVILIFTRQLRFVILRRFEAEEAFFRKSALYERKKLPAGKAATPNSCAPPMVVSILRRHFGPVGDRWRT